MEMYYSSLTGEGQGSGSGLSADEIEQRLNTYNGLAGYEPLPVLVVQRRARCGCLVNETSTYPLDAVR